MVERAPYFKDIAKDALGFIGTCTVVCHNAGFDLGFVCKELADNGFKSGAIYYIDTLKLSRQYFSFDSNSLGNIASAIGVEVNLKHRAMADVLTMFSVSKYLFSNMYRKGVDSIEASLYKYAYA
jgi:DNA polymerase III alpha subunit (gram-positive type)